MTDRPLPEPSQMLTGKTAIVTGATSGLGWRFARVLANAGAKAVVTGRRVDRLEALVELIEGEGGEALAIPVDMTDRTSILSMVDQAEVAFGSVDIAINNAGTNDIALAANVDIDIYDQLMSTNVRGPFILSTEIARRLIQAKKPGRIVNLSSIAADDYLGDGAAIYSISKAAISKMTVMLGTEWAKFHINVNAIAPGFFESEMSENTVDQIGEFWRGLRRQRLCHPALLDSTILYLCSPASEAVTGAVIRVTDAQMPM